MFLGWLSFILDFSTRSDDMLCLVAQAESVNTFHLCRIQLPLDSYGNEAAHRINLFSLLDLGSSLGVRLSMIVERRILVFSRSVEYHTSFGCHIILPHYCEMWQK